MEEKNNFTTEELRKQCEEAKTKFEALNEQLKQAEKEEEKHRKEQLALEKENRTKELNDAIDNANDLLNKWIKDYGPFTYKNVCNKSLFDLGWPFVF